MTNDDIVQIYYATYRKSKNVVTSQVFNFYILYKNIYINIFYILHFYKIY